MLHCWLAPLVHMHAKAASMLLTSHEPMRLRLQVGGAFFATGACCSPAKAWLQWLVMTPSPAGLTLRARESLMWDRRLVSTCRSCWILAFSPSSFWICF